LTPIHIDAAGGLFYFSLTTLALTGYRDMPWLILRKSGGDRRG
jgi:hypothetical protein